jgi:hypothetical protein
MSEVRNMNEGTLRWVQASGNGRAWITASGAPSGVIGSVTDFRFESARQVITVPERGVPSHHKVVGWTPVQVSFDLQWGVTGDVPPLIGSGGGTTVPLIHLELKSTAPEIGGAIYFQFFGVTLAAQGFAVGLPADTLRWHGSALAMNGPSASGYLG